MPEVFLGGDGIATHIHAPKKEFKKKSDFRVPNL